MRNLLFILLLAPQVCTLGQSDSSHNQRLDFAKMYFEVGGTYQPTHQAFYKNGATISEFSNPAYFSPYLNWGGFHFWGHADFYVKFPLAALSLKETPQYYEQTHAVVTGLRYMPWKIKHNTVRPYLGISWSAFDFQFQADNKTTYPNKSKDFQFTPEFGFLYTYKDYALRIGATYLYDTNWKYPLSTSEFKSFNTPNWNFMIGFNYSFESSSGKDKERNEKWNNYPSLSKPGHGRTVSGDYFIGAGPSGSFSLRSSEYNRTQLPYLKDKLISTFYIDYAIGYHSYERNLFMALSYRNPSFGAKGFDATQEIVKHSLLLEANKFITDYTGFAPYIGINIALDHYTYNEQSTNNSTAISFNRIDPGISFGWDIIPGKTDEALILRTNLRWFPLSSFQVDGKRFDFSQLEYNLIQVIFYPSRLKRNKT